MRKIAVLLSTILIFASCAHANSLEDKAIKSMVGYLTEGKLWKLRVSDEKVCFANDSLCIIHAQVSEKNKFGAMTRYPVEYIMISYDGDFYEAYHNIENGDTINISVQEYKKTNDYNIYRELSYEGTLYYLATIVINNYGRNEETGEGGVFIPTYTGTGMWRIVDGDKVKENMDVCADGYGTYSNGIENDAELRVTAFVNTAGVVSLRMKEHGVKDVIKPGSKFYTTVTTPNGCNYYVMFECGETGVFTEPLGMVFGDFEKSDILSDVVNVNDVVKFHMFQDTDSELRTTYDFMIDLRGLSKAKEYCREIEFRPHLKKLYVQRGEKFVQTIQSRMDYKKIGNYYCKVIKNGTGSIPTKKSRVYYTWELRSIDGHVYYKSTSTYPWPLRTKTEDMREVLMHMRAGSIWDVVIPSEFCEWKKGLRGSKPYETLIERINIKSVEYDSEDE